jgi:5'-nucleotidase
MILLVDMDGVIADFEEGHARMCSMRGLPDHVVAAGRTTWDLLATLDEPWKATVLELWHTPGFFQGLRPIPGARETLHTLLGDGVDVFLCTAPMIHHETCAQEKLTWVVEHLGREFASRVILARDKTLIHGDFLVDDRPLIPGLRVPTWEHLIFDQPYNQGPSTQRRVTWHSLIPALMAGLKPSSP